MRTVEVRARALVDIEGAATYISVVFDSPNAAEHTMDAIIASIKQAAELPELGRIFICKGLATSYRRVLSGKYWIFYTFTDETLTVWRIVHVTQDVDRYGFDSFE
ncbi:MAG: type II toxin-antitoxin system RelE/ParE family toxin [Raoultibacter sp.]